MRKIEILLGLLLATLPVFAQTTPEAAVAAALQNHPLTKAAAFDVQAKKYGEKAAFNLPNPELNAESPTGEFYTIGVTQSFEFPTVYTRQKKVAQAETALAQAGQRVSENELRYTVRSLYLETQVAEYAASLWAGRDSLYQAMVATAIRQFTGGEIDFLQRTLAEQEAGGVRQERIVAERNAVALRQLLATYTGLNDIGTLLPLQPDTVGLLSVDMAANPSVGYEQQAAQVAERQISLAKSRALPNFSLGYLNQSVRNTPVDYRFKASIGIPLWAGQYRAATNAAQAESQAASTRAAAQSQSVGLDLVRAQTEAATTRNRLQYYQREALPRSRAIITTATRMRAAGEVDYLTFLRTLEGAYSIQWAYADQVQALNVAQLRLRYLSGQ